MITALRLSAASLLLVVLTGCGGEDNGPPRLPVTGKVSLASTPLKDGVISFSPVGKTEPIASGDIKDGVYSLDRSNGPLAGPHRVSILSSELLPTGRKIPDPEHRGRTLDVTRNAVPERYNVNTNLSVEVKADGNNTFDFDLGNERVAARTNR